MATKKNKAHIVSQLKSQFDFLTHYSFDGETFIFRPFSVLSSCFHDTLGTGLLPLQRKQKHIKNPPGCYCFLSLLQSSSQTFFSMKQ